MPYRLRTRTEQNHLLVDIYVMARAFARGAIKGSDVDDVAGDVVLYCLNKFRSREWKKLPENAQALVRAIVKARVADILRRAEVAKENEQQALSAESAHSREWMSPDHAWDEASIDEYQAAVMKTLPRRCRLAYYLVRVEGDSYEQAAERMQVSPSTICNQVVRAQRAFRQELRRIGINVPEARSNVQEARSNEQSTHANSRSPDIATRTRGSAGQADRNALRARGAAALPPRAKSLSQGGNMQLKQSNILRGLQDIQKFLDERAAELPGLGETGMRKKFDDMVAQLRGLAETQDSATIASRSLTLKINALSQELIEHRMANIARIAAVELPPGPELLPLSMPKKRVYGERLLARARGMAGQAVKFEQTFIAAGLPSDFVKQLRDAADELSALHSARKQNVADRGASTKLLQTHIKEVRKVLKVLDGFVRTTAKGNSRVLVTWKILKRLRQTIIEPTETEASIAGTTTTPAGVAA